MKLLNNSLYPTIFTRKSTRKYTDNPVSADIVKDLQSFISDVPPLFPSEQASFDIQPYKGSKMKIAAYAKSEAASFMNLAFMLQQMDLFLQTNGLGALWNATIRATVKEYQDLPYGISLIFGVAEESPVRSGSHQFERKQPGEIASKSEFPFIEAIRLAPSARNRQPWYLVCENKCIHFYCIQGNFIDKTLLKNLQWIDIGIAVCHAVLALQNENFSPAAIIKTNMPEKKGYTYCVSLEWEG